MLVDALERRDGLDAPCPDAVRPWEAHITEWSEQGHHYVDVLQAHRWLAPEELGELACGAATRKALALLEASTVIR